MRRRPLPPVREENSNVKSWRNIFESDLVIYTLVVCVGALTYANSLDGEFVHDDIPAIVSNSDVNGGNPVLTVFWNDFWGMPMSNPHSHKSYRPLTTLSFRVNYALFGPSPRWWHACNVALHAACCALVLRAGSVLARLGRPFAALAALLFAVHPVHTEAVAGVVGRADVLACVFFLSSILLYHGYEGRHRVWASVAMAALGMLAKETGLTALLFNVGFDLYRNWNSIVQSRTLSPGAVRGKRGPGAAGANSFAWRCARALVALVVLSGLRLALLQGSLPAFSPQDNPPAFHPSFTVRTLTFCYLAAFNWWLLLCPWTLSHDWQMGSVPLVTSLWDPRNALTCAAFVTFLALAYKCLSDLEIQRHTPLVVGVMLLIIPYLPASNLLVTVGFVVAERVLYIPSVGSVLLVVYGAQLAWRRGGARLVVLAAALLACAGAARTLHRNQDWRNRETLLRADLAVLPQNAKLHYNFANFLKDTDQHEDAIQHYKEALKLWPSYASAHNNLGTLVVATGAAEHHFLEALKYNRDHVNAHFNLANLYRKKDRIAEAVAMLERCVALEPRFGAALAELALLSARRSLLDRLLLLEPDRWDHYLLYGGFLATRGLVTQALEYYMRAVQLSFAKDPQGQGPSVRATCLLLRAQGKRARVLQLITRWHAARGGGPAPAQRAAATRAWRLRAELAGRAARYDRPAAPRTSTSTCLHHSQLEVSSNPYVLVSTHDATIADGEPTDKDGCQKHNETKKNVTVIDQLKPKQNKSMTAHKKKKNSAKIVHKDKKMKNDDLFQQYNHLIKTF